MRISAVDLKTDLHTNARAIRGIRRCVRCLSESCFKLARFFCGRYLHKQCSRNVRNEPAASRFKSRAGHNESCTRILVQYQLSRFESSGASLFFRVTKTHAFTATVIFFQRYISFLYSIFTVRVSKPRFAASQRRVFT